MFWVALQGIPLLSFLAEAKTAANDAATKVREQIGKFQAATELAAVTTLMEEIKEHHRSHNWPVLPARYSAARIALIQVRESAAIEEIHSQLKQAFTTPIQNLWDMERESTSTCRR